MAEKPSIDELISRQRSSLKVVKTHDVDVVMGGEYVTVTLEKMQSEEWDSLVSANPPRKTVPADLNIGYNPRGLSAQYLRVSVEGERLSKAKWATFYRLLDSVFKNRIDAVIWGINVQDVVVELSRLGKARRGQ